MLSDAAPVYAEADGSRLSFNGLPEAFGQPLLVFPLNRIASMLAFIDRKPLESCQDFKGEIYKDSKGEMHEDFKGEFFEDLSTRSPSCDGLPEAFGQPHFVFPSDSIASMPAFVNRELYESCQDFKAEVYEDFKREIYEDFNFETKHEESASAEYNFTRLELLPFDCARNLKYVGEVVARLAKLRNRRIHWWKSSHAICPLTSFPIKLLPYPPFNLKMPTSSRTLVDGKALALSMISACNFVGNGWCSNAANVTSLGDYMQRCKLGPFRPDLAMALQKTIASPEVTEAERGESAQKLNQMIAAARAELEKLQCLQEQRLLRMYQNLTGGLPCD